MKDPFDQPKEEDDKSEISLRDCIVSEKFAQSYKIPAYALISVYNLATHIKEIYSPTAIKVGCFSQQFNGRRRASHN
jgi:hypothetical protein